MDLVLYLLLHLLLYGVVLKQGTIMSLAALTQPDIVKRVEAAALLCPISYLEHVNAPFVLRMVNMYLDKVNFFEMIFDNYFNFFCFYLLWDWKAQGPRGWGTLYY